MSASDAAKAVHAAEETSRAVEFSSGDDGGSADSVLDQEWGPGGELRTSDGGGGASGSGGGGSSGKERGDLKQQMGSSVLHNPASSAPAAASASSASAAPAAIAAPAQLSQINRGPSVTADIRPPDGFRRL